MEIFQITSYLHIELWYILLPFLLAASVVLKDRYLLCLNMLFLFSFYYYIYLSWYRSAFSYLSFSRCLSLHVYFKMSHFTEWVKFVLFMAKLFMYLMMSLFICVSLGFDCTRLLVYSIIPIAPLILIAANSPCHRFTSHNRATCGSSHSGCRRAASTPERLFWMMWPMPRHSSLSSPRKGSLGVSSPSGMYSSLGGMASSWLLVGDFQRINVLFQIAYSIFFFNSCFLFRCAVWHSLAEYWAFVSPVAWRTVCPSGSRTLSQEWRCELYLCLASRTNQKNQHRKGSS